MATPNTPTHFSDGMLGGRAVPKVLVTEESRQGRAAKSDNGNHEVTKALSRSPPTAGNYHHRRSWSGSSYTRSRRQNTLGRPRLVYGSADAWSAQHVALEHVAHEQHHRDNLNPEQDVVRIAHTFQETLELLYVGVLWRGYCQPRNCMLCVVVRCQHKRLCRSHPRLFECDHGISDHCWYWWATNARRAARTRNRSWIDLAKCWKGSVTGERCGEVTRPSAK